MFCLSANLLDRLEIHVVVEMEIVQVLSVDEKVEHVVALTADLQAGLHPVEPSRLEELRGLQLSEQVLLRHCLLRPCLQLVQDEALKQFLIRHADLDRLARRAVLQVPVLHQRYVLCTPHAT